MVTWDAPIKQIQRGCNAWQEWNYRLFVKPYYEDFNEKQDTPEIMISNITGTSYLFSNNDFKSLSNVSNAFSFTVKATSESGKLLLNDKDCQTHLN